MVQRENILAPGCGCGRARATIPVGQTRASRLRIGTDFDTQRLLFSLRSCRVRDRRAKLKVELSSRLGAPATAGIDALLPSTARRVERHRHLGSYTFSRPGEAGSARPACADCLAR